MRDPAALSLAQPEPDIVNEGTYHITGMSYYIEGERRVSTSLDDILGGNGMHPVQAQT